MSIRKPRHGECHDGAWGSMELGVGGLHHPVDEPVELLDERIHVAELLVGESSDNAGVRGLAEDREDAPDGPRELVLLDEPHHLLDDLHDLVVSEHIVGTPEHPLVATAAQIAHDVGVDAGDVNVEALSAMLRVKERLQRDGLKLDGFHFVSLL